MKERTSGVWVKTGKPREPLFRLAELAQEFGVPVTKLRQNIVRLSGPEPVFKGNTNEVRHHYYSPSEVRVWWKSLSK